MIRGGWPDEGGGMRVAEGHIFEKEGQDNEEEKREKKEGGQDFRARKKR